LVWQVLFESQHPLGHEAAVQPHFPVDVLHASPAGHAAQTAPAAPQLAFVSLAYGTQVFPLQHPFGHDVASHAHVWVADAHSWPVRHAVHFEPPVPQTALVSLAYGTQAFPLQQPLAHDVESQTHAVPLHS
jgi:hypothetical protein